MADVTAQHADYTAREPQWRLVADAAAGEAAVKAGKETYLPRPNPNDKTTEAVSRYEQYVARAVYYNATGRTLRTMVGMGFFRSPEVAVPGAIDYATKDVNGAGVSLNQQAQSALANVMVAGRAGLLTDFPKVENPAQTSRAEEVQKGLRPTISLYGALAIINWRTTRVGGATVLSLVVLSETYDVEDGFATKAEPQYRVLRLQEGLYQQEIWRKRASSDGKSEWVIAEMLMPVDGAGNRLDRIPFQFIGAQNNDSSVDDAPLYDIASLNIAHYHNSADYEESVFFCGQPMYYMAGLSTEWVEMLEKKGIFIGSRAILPLPVGGSAGILQAEANTLAGDAMKAKESQMAALGARLLIATQQSKTATQQDSEDEVSHSALSLGCANVSAAYTEALVWFGRFAGVTSGKISYELSTDFSSRHIDPTELSALLQLVQAGQLPETDLWRRLRDIGLIAADKDDDKVREEIASQTPPGAGDVDPLTGKPIDQGGDNGDQDE